MVRHQQHIMLGWACNSFLYTYIFVCFASVLTAFLEMTAFTKGTILSDSLYI